MTHRISSRYALALILFFGLPTTVVAQGKGEDSARDTASVKDLPLTAEQRQAYIGGYKTELPGGEKVTLRILEKNGALMLWASNPDEARRLLYQGDHVFLVENTPGFVLKFGLWGNTAMMFTVHKPEGDLLAMRLN